jgi:hypothetical protein
MAGVENDLVDRRVEHPVHRDGQLDHAEIRPEVAARPRHRLDQQVTDLAGQHGQLVRRDLLEFPRAGDGFQQGHLGCSLM